MHLLGPQLKCQIGRRTSPSYRFCGEGRENTFKMYQNVSLHVQGPPQKHLEHVTYILGMSPHKTVVIL